MANKYLKGNRASVMNTTIEVKVLCKEQFNEIVSWLVTQEYNFEFEKILTSGGEHFILTIYNIPWIRNIVAIAEKLSENDYDFDG